MCTQCWLSTRQHRLHWPHVHPYLCACPLQITFPPRYVFPRHSTWMHIYIHSCKHSFFLLLSIPHSKTPQSFLWFPCCTLACGRSIYNHRFWGLYLLLLRCYKHGYQSPATCVTSLCLIPAGFNGMTTLWRWSLMTTWTSSAPITPRARCHRWTPSATCSTWWSERTSTPASPSHMTRCAGNAVIHLPLTLPRNSLKNSSVLLRLPWGRSFAKEKATTTSVSVSRAFYQLNLFSDNSTSL